MINNLNKPLFSIVLPTFNHGHYICRAIESVLQQTFVDWELIIVDNYSVDETKKIVSSYKDSRIKYFQNNNYGIIATSRNFGINKSSGDWVAFLDSDDWWVDHKLEFCKKYLNSEVDLIYHNVIMIDHKTKKRIKNIRSRKLNNPILKDLLINGNEIVNSSVVVRLEILKQIGGINESRLILAAEDYHTWLNISLITNNFFLISEALGYYLCHSDNISKKNMYFPIKYVVNDFKNHLNYSEFNKSKSEYIYMNIRYRYKHKQFNRLTTQIYYCILNNDKFFIKLKCIYMLFSIYYRIFKLRFL